MKKKTPITSTTIDPDNVNNAGEFTACPNAITDHQRQLLLCIDRDRFPIATALAEAELKRLASAKSITDAERDFIAFATNMAKELAPKGGEEALRSELNRIKAIIEQRDPARNQTDPASA